MGNHTGSLFGTSNLVGRVEPCSPVKCILIHWNTLKPIVTTNIVFKKEKLKTLCKFIWPTYYIGPNEGTWPPEGSLDLDFIKKFTDFLATIRRTEEELYVGFFFNLLYRPDIRRAYGLNPTPSSRICPLVTFKKGNKLAKVTEEEEEFPPPYYAVPPSPNADAAPLLVQTPPAASQPASQEQAIPTAPQPGLQEPELPSTPLLSQPVSQDSTPQAAQSLYPELSALSPPHTRTGLTYMPASLPGPSILAPLRQVPMKDQLVFVHTPFTTNDLFNWKAGLPPYRESPQSYVELFQRVIATHRPNVPDLFTLLSALLSTEEKQQVLKATMANYNAAREHGIQTNHDAAALWPEPLVLFSPSYEVDPNTDQGTLILQRARDFILQGLKLGVPKTVNFHRVHQILQNPKESPADFLNRLKDGFRRFTDLDPDNPANDVLLKMTFVGQSAPDIRKKLQKLETPTAKDLETLVQTAFTVYAQREEEEEKKEDRRMRKQAALLAAALSPQKRGRGTSAKPPLQRDQCARCHQSGHWKRECPLEQRIPSRGRGQYRGRGGFRPEAPAPSSLMSAQASEFYPENY
ncbi:uncharacterized protein LOC131189073 [Ahaetulla prasina]|uniref:uncharacterized protein LOC131189073 n=1 Tax=Ahaetulla prasina TaxID=499056 RepID=UPI0026490061|nr:uncharacterized protein LOC131189073 [Ahaetulla prasina]